MSEFLNTKTFFLKDIHLIHVNKIQYTVPWTYLINDLHGKKIKGSFYEKELQKTGQKEFRIKKVIKKKGNKLQVKWKVMAIVLIAGLMKKTYYK